MRQQINLYPPLLNKHQSNIPYIIAICLYGLFILVLMLYSGYQMWENHLLSRQNNNLEAQLANANNQLIALTKQSNLNKDTIDEVLKEVQSQQAVAEKATNFIVVQNPFSDYLTALAKSITSGVWLTNITIDHDNNRIELSGNSYYAEAVQTFTKTLSRTLPFSSSIFEISELNQAIDAHANNRVYFNFRIANTATGQKS